MSESVPTPLQERLARLQQLQQTLQIVVAEKQRVELELSETEKAIAELKGLDDNALIFKSIGSLLIKASRGPTLKELEEKKELLDTRVIVLAKQEERAKEKLRELQRSIQEELKAVEEKTETE